MALSNWSLLIVKTWPLSTGLMLIVGLMPNMNHITIQSKDTWLDTDQLLSLVQYITDIDPSEFTTQDKLLLDVDMMTSSNGNIFCITGHLCGEFTADLNSPHKGQWRGTLMLSLICAWMNGWVNNPEAGDLRWHRAHYDVTVMAATSISRGKQKDDLMTSDEWTEGLYTLHNTFHYKGEAKK